MERRKGPFVLGLAASHNGATCLLEGGVVRAAVQEERLTRHKRAVLRAGREFAGLDYVLGAAGIGVDDLDLVALAALHGPDAPDDRLEDHPRLAGVPRIAVAHHRAHAISAYVTSGLRDAAVVVIDGMGSPFAHLDAAEQAAVVGSGPREREAASIYQARDGRLWALEKHLAAPYDVMAPPCDSDLLPFTTLGMMYQAVAQKVFGHWSHAGKVMGLSPYGRRRWPTEAFFRVAPDGTLAFDQVAVRGAFAAQEDPWPAHQGLYEDLACSLQAAFEDGVMHLARRARALSDSRALCLAGGCALNGIANERVIRSGMFDEVYVIPAAEDCGTALGAAWEGLWALEGPRVGQALGSDALGRSYGEGEIEAALGAVARPQGCRVQRLAEVGAVAARGAEALAAGAVLGWLQGGSELGPRALGQRSLLLDPRRADGKDHLNARVKHREAFRPFAPAVLEEAAAGWFELPAGAERSPFMLRVVPVRPERRAAVPAIVHVDGSARLQTVGREAGPFRALVEAFERRTGVPMVLNTSFNLAGEPIVETPADALRTFFATGIDILVIDHWVIEKTGLDS